MDVFFERVQYRITLWGTKEKMFFTELPKSLRRNYEKRKVDAPGDVAVAVGVADGVIVGVGVGAVPQVNF